MHSGIPQYGGSVKDFHDWEFRTNVKLRTCKDENKPELIGKIIDGLRDKPFELAREMGIEKLISKDGISILIDKVKKHLFNIKNWH